MIGEELEEIEGKRKGKTKRDQRGRK